jgi:hypothetical protein
MSDEDPNHFCDSIVQDNPIKIADIRLCNQNVEIFTVDKMYEEKTKNGVFGSFCHYPKPVIHASLHVLNEDAFQFRSTLLHEIIEGIGSINNLCMTEAQIRVLEQSLMGFCSDNRDEAGYILFGLKTLPKKTTKKPKKRGVLKKL